MAEPRHRRATIIALGIATLVLVVLLGGLNAFKLKFLAPHSLAQIQIFTGLSVLVFLLFVVLLVLLLRNILKNLAEQRSRVLGSRLRSRMLIGAALISFAPALFMILFSYWLLNRSIDRWFTQPVSQLRESSTRIAYDLANYGTLNARAEAESIVSSESFLSDYQAVNRPALLSALRDRQITLQGGFAVVYRNNIPLIEYAVPQGAQSVSIRAWIDEKAPPTIPSSKPLTSVVLRAAESSDESVLSIGDTDYSVAAAALPNGGLLAVALPLPSGLGAAARHIRAGASHYWVLYRERHSVRNMYMLLLLLLSVLVFFSSSWLALYLSKQITRPVEALADAMDEIGEGRYSRRVTINATQELGELVRSFNHMAADLEQSRARAESSAAQLSAANASLDARRKELETVLETIPSSVARLDADGVVLQANRAFLHLVGGQNPDSAAVFGKYLAALFPAEIATELELLERRAHRMGLAATEFELPGPSGALNLTATIAALDLDENRRGSIVVMEDVTEFLRAQREVAWKQVAQRVAHEIKNPLTPVALSAERIRRHMDRAQPDSPNVIRRCVEVILASVESMRVLVDQFSALAEFPAAHPKPGDLNAIVTGALLLFHGRLDGIRIVQRLDPALPLVMADTRSLERALANLIDNAAEAMQASLVRVLTITTRLSENQEMAELTLSDTGHGLTDEMRERLFLPYVSSKQRGTGLGLAIAAKIIQQHGGSIRAESNASAGALFVIELPLAAESLSQETPSPVEASEQPQ